MTFCLRNTADPFEFVDVVTHVIIYRFYDESSRPPPVGGACPGIHNRSTPAMISLSSPV